MNLMTNRWQHWGIIIPLLALLETTSWGGTNAAAAKSKAAEGNRFLLILETSKSMKRQSEAALAVVEELFNTKMHGQLRARDTVGLWTYNEQLYAGRLPAQDWTPESAKEVRDRTLEFLAAQKFEKKGNLEKVLPLVAQVVNDSELITVILVSSGENKLAGSPYDSEINEYYKTWREKERKAPKPFVTIFRGERGKLTQYSVCQVPQPIDIPALPPERETPQLAQQKAATPPAKKAPPPMGKSLIVTGSSRKTEAVEMANSAAVAVPIPQPRVLEAPRDPRLETAEEIVARLLAEAGQPREITPPLKVISTHGSSSNSTVVKAGTNGNSMATVISQSGMPAAEGYLAASNAKVSTTPQTVPAVAVLSTSAMPNKVGEPAALVKADPVRPQPEAANTSTAALASTPSEISEPLATKKEVATTALPGSFLERKSVQRAALALAAGAIACLLIALRRPKPVYQASIITRSLERELR